jgi:hypothetical protein
MRPLVAIASQQFASSGQGPDAVCLLPVSGGMGVAKPFDPFSANFDPGLAKKLVGEQASAHANLAMDAPHRQFYAVCIERFLPCKDVLIDAVNERAIEIKQEDRFYTHAISPVLEVRCHQRRGSAPSPSSPR